MGFQPETERSGDRVTFTMRNCPYRAVATRDPDCVCGLHRGMTRGLIDAVTAGARLAEFTPREPRLAGCRVVVEGLTEPAAAGSGR
jgi:predicted ArsR family transcriptional regulator